MGQFRVIDILGCANCAIARPYPWLDPANPSADISIFLIYLSLKASIRACSVAFRPPVNTIDCRLDGAIGASTLETCATNCPLAIADESKLELRTYESNSCLSAN